MLISEVLDDVNTRGGSGGGGGQSPHLFEK